MPSHNDDPTLTRHHIKKLPRRLRGRQRAHFPDAADFRNDRDRDWLAPIAGSLARKAIAKQLAYPRHWNPQITQG